MGIFEKQTVLEVWRTLRLDHLRKGNHTYTRDQMRDAARKFQLEQAEEKPMLRAELKEEELRRGDLIGSEMKRVGECIEQSGNNEYLRPQINGAVRPEEIGDLDLLPPPLSEL